MIVQVNVLIKFCITSFSWIERFMWFNMDRHDSVYSTRKNLNILDLVNFVGSYFHLKDKLINHPLPHFLSNERKFQINFFPGGECFLPQKPWYQGQFLSQNILQGLLSPEKIANTSRRRISWLALPYPAQPLLNN